MAGLSSAVISPVGETLAATTNYTDHVTATINLDCCVVHLDYNRERLASMKSKYGRQVKIKDPGFLGAVLVSSETPELSVRQIIGEFRIEPLDDYWARALRHRRENTEPAA